MSYNKRQLQKDKKELTKAKAPGTPKDIIYDPRGQWAHPGQPTRIPGNDITMKGVPYPVYGVDNTGYGQMMYPGVDYTFPGEYVDEYPQLKKGGIPKLVKLPNKKGSKGYSRSVEATNKLFTENTLFDKPKSRKKKVFDPSSKYYQNGGFKTKLNPEEENEFQNFYNTLPDNLMSDEPDYDIRGYWDALGRPSEFDYSQPKESDGYYHAFSINPNTGEYLKAPFHNTFQHAITEDRKMGWRPTVNVQGRIIATENPSIADPEEQTFLRNTEGPVAYQKGGIQDGLYTFSGRPGSEYKYQNGQWYIANKGTNNIYVPMQDPTGNRAKTLMAGIKSGKTKMLGQIPATQNKTRYQNTIPNIAVDNTRVVQDNGLPKDIQEVKRRQEAAQRAFEESRRDEIKQGQEYGIGAKTWDVITNPFTAAEYIISGGGLQNMPRNINEMRIAGIDPGVVQGRNLVGNTVNAFTNLVDAGDKVIRNVGKGNYLDAGLEAMRFIPGARLSTGLGKKAGKYLTTQTPLRNTYKINPFAVKENPEMFLYRTQPKDFVAGYTEEQQLKDLITDKILKGEKVPFYLQGKLNKIKYQPEPFRKALDEYHGQWFDKNPERMDFYMEGRLDGDEGNILRLKVPKEEGLSYNLKNFPEAQKASLNYDTEFIVPRNKISESEIFSTKDWQQLVQEDKAFNTPHWLRGYKEVPKELPGSPNLSGSKQFITDTTIKPSYNIDDVLKNEPAFDKVISERLSLLQSPEGQRRLQEFIEKNEMFQAFNDVSKGVKKYRTPLTNEDYLNALAQTENAERLLFQGRQQINELRQAYKEGRISQQDYENYVESYKKFRDNLGYNPDNAYQEGKILGKNNNVISIGHNLNPQEARIAGRHEVTHFIQDNEISHLDEELSNLDLIDNSNLPENTYKADPKSEFTWSENEKATPDYYTKSKNYWESGSSGREKLAMTEDIRSDLLESGKIKSLYDEVTPEMLVEHYKDYMLNRSNRFPLRVFDIMKNDSKNFKLLSKVINKMPALVPVAIGAGAAATQQSESTQPKMQKGGPVFVTSNKNTPTFIGSGKVKQEPKKEKVVNKPTPGQPVFVNKNAKPAVIIGNTDKPKVVVSNKSATPFQDIINPYVAQTKQAMQAQAQARSKTPFQDILNPIVDKAEKNYRDIMDQEYVFNPMQFANTIPQDKVKAQPIANSMAADFTNIGKAGEMNYTQLEEARKNYKNLPEVKSKTAWDTFIDNYNKAMSGWGTTPMVDEDIITTWGSAANRKAQKLGFVDIDENKIDPNKTKQIKAPVNTNKPEPATFYQELPTVIDKANNKPLLAYRSQWDNKNGFVYLTTPVQQDRKPEVYTNVKGVAHFNLDASPADAVTYMHPNNVAYIRKAKEKNDYIPVYESLGNNKVKLQYKKYNELSPAQKKQIDKLLSDFKAAGPYDENNPSQKHIDIAKNYARQQKMQSQRIVAPLRQYKFDDIKFNETKKPDGFSKGIKEVKTKDGQGTYLIFKDRNGYSRFSGGSVVFIFEDQNGNRVVRDFAGTLNNIENEGMQIQKDYKLKPGQLIIGYHDVGSFSAKPKADAAGNLSTDQWADYNTFNNSSGSALIIPK